MMVINKYSQQDPKWKDLPLGDSNTIGSHGCLITTLCNQFRNYAIDITPPEMVTRLKKYQGISPSGDLQWPQVQVAFPPVSFRARIWTSLAPPNYAREQISVSLEKIQKLLSFGQPVALNVDASFQDGLADHWIMAYDPEGLRIIDAWDGWDGKFEDKYGAPEKGIFGYAVQIGPPIGFPDGGFPTLGQATWKLSQAERGVHTMQYVKEALDHLLGV